MMRKLSLLTIVGLMSIPSFAAAQEVDAAGEAAMLVRINVLREDAQLAPLVRSAELDLAARAHSSDMAERSVIEHVSPMSGTPADRVLRAGVSSTTIAENVAMHRDTAHALEALIASDGHRANILAPNVTHVGLASVQTPSGVYVTQVFALIEVQPEAEPEPVVVEQAPAAEPEEPVSIFQIIPPFVEQLLGAASAAQAADIPAVVPTPVYEADPSEVPALEVPSLELPSLEAVEAPAAQDPSAPAALPAPQMTRETQAALRQMIGLAQSILGGAVTVQ